MASARRGSEIASAVDLLLVRGGMIWKKHSISIIDKSYTNHYQIINSIITQSLQAEVDEFRSGNLFSDVRVGNLPFSESVETGLNAVRLL